MFCFKNKNKDKNELNQSQNQQTSDNIKKDTISLAERRGQKIKTFNLVFSPTYHWCNKA